MRIKVSAIVVAAAVVLVAGVNLWMHRSASLQRHRMLDLCVKGQADAAQKPRQVNDALWIAMASWNDPGGLRNSVRSVCSQRASYASVELIVFQDRSDSLLSEAEQRRLARLCQDGNGMHTKCTVTFLQVPPNQLGAAAGKWILFKHIRRRAAPDDYVLVLDGDDVFSHHAVLAKIRRTLSAHRPWFAWGKISGRFQEQCGPLPTPAHEFRNMVATTPDRQTWPICHPRMFRSSLLTTLTEDDFRRADGSWLQKSTDRSFMLNFVEQSGDERIHFFGDEPLVNYSWTPNNGLLRFRRDSVQGDKNDVNNRAPMMVHPDTIVVISCIFDRNNSFIFFRHLASSRLKPNTLMEVHICNNAPERQIELEAHARSATNQAEAGDLIKVSVHNMRENTYGFGRFLLARQLMDRRLLDYFVMIDDDQYVNHDQIQALYDARQPQTYLSWYGKNWYDGNRDYWHANETWITQNPRGAPRPEAGEDAVGLGQRKGLGYSTWQYGGTGMSIVDASVLRSEGLFEARWQFYDVEDMWLSYVVHRIGWTIKRYYTTVVLAPSSPTGLYRRLRTRKQDVFVQLGYLKPCIEMHLHGTLVCVPHEQ